MDQCEISKFWFNNVDKVRCRCLRCLIDGGADRKYWFLHYRDIRGMLKSGPQRLASGIMTGIMPTLLCKGAASFYTIGPIMATSRVYRAIENAPVITWIAHFFLTVMQKQVRHVVPNAVSRRNRYGKRVKRWTAQEVRGDTESQRKIISWPVEIARIGARSVSSSLID